MPDRMIFPEGDPRHYTAKLKQMLTETMEQARKDVAKIDDPKAQALFETTAEVLGGLKKAYEHFVAAFGGSLEGFGGPKFVMAEKS